jgi:hypothetical protein
LGISSGISVHARNRDGQNRCIDHGKAEALHARRGQWRAIACLILSLCIAFPGFAGDSLRVAFFHTELSRDGPGLLLRDIVSDEDAQIEAVVEVVHAVRPDVLVLAGLDWDLESHALSALADRIGGYPHRFSARPNRGIDSRLDLNRNGRLGEPEDAIGFAEFAGQGALAVLSNLPIDLEDWSDFSGLAWRELTDASFDGADEAVLPLSTTAHWDLPLLLPGGGRLNLLVWHATPPVFDGAEDRNGRRNHDEALFWLRYLDGDFGQPPERFILLGTANLDPIDGDGRPAALKALLDDPRIRDVRPSSKGGTQAQARDGGVNLTHSGDPSLDTADWPDNADQPGNLRVDYVLPASGLTVRNAGVFWPLQSDTLCETVQKASRHRLVWVDIALD